MNGDVRLRVEGLMLERLIQRAIREGARFRRISRHSPRAMILETDPNSAAIVIALCERFSLPCEVLARRGCDAMLRKLRQRATLLAAMLSCIAALALFFSRIWMIDIEMTGTRAAATASIEAALQEMGIRPGMAKSSVDAELLGDALSAAAPDFSFIGVQLQGVRLLVEAAPAVSAPELYELDSGRDLIAQCDGVVESISVLSGAACVQPGDTVIRGQVLIRGDERIAKDVSRPIAALGSVVARTWYEGSASAPLARRDSVPTGRSSLSAELRLLNFAWPLLEGERYSSQEEQTEILPIGGLFLPLEIHRTVRHETREQCAENDPSLLRRQLALLAFAEAGAQLTQSHPGGGEIADQWIEYTQTAGVLHARAVYEMHTNIAVTRDALYQQGG